MIIQSSGLLYLLYRIITSETRVIILRSNRSVQGPQSSSNTVTPANGTIQQKKMESSVSGTDQPEDQNVLRRPTSTALQPIKYTPAQLHEIGGSGGISRPTFTPTSNYVLQPRTIRNRRKPGLHVKNRYSTKDATFRYPVKRNTDVFSTGRTGYVYKNLQGDAVRDETQQSCSVDHIIIGAMDSTQERDQKIAKAAKNILNERIRIRGRTQDATSSQDTHTTQQTRAWIGGQLRNSRIMDHRNKEWTIRKDVIGQDPRRRDQFGHRHHQRIVEWQKQRGPQVHLPHRPRSVFGRLLNEDRATTDARWDPRNVQRKWNKDSTSWKSCLTNPRRPGTGKPRHIPAWSTRRTDELQEERRNHAAAFKRGVQDHEETEISAPKKSRTMQETQPAVAQTESSPPNHRKERCSLNFMDHVEINASKILAKPPHPQMLPFFQQVDQTVIQFFTQMLPLRRYMENEVVEQVISMFEMSFDQLNGYKQGCEDRHKLDTRHHRHVWTEGGIQHLPRTTKLQGHHLHERLLACQEKRM